jgi:hypothetical protein
MKKSFLSPLIVLILFCSLLLGSCIPVAIVNRNFDSTYVYLKFSPDEARDGIKEGTIKGTIYVDDALLPPRHSRNEGRISRCIIIPHGKHKLTISADGYRTWEKEIFFSGRHLALKVELIK